jgi:adenylylsulfate kinase-like enzyme
MDETEKIKQAAEEFARQNKKRIAQELTDIAKFAPDEVPASVFMGGSPGAGKTEYSKNLIDSIERDQKHKVIRIDGDELRQYLPGYSGNNSYLFQGAISIIVDKIHDMAIDNKQTFLLDGTLSKYDKATSNIKRSLDKNRKVHIFYVYQKPEVAWKFTMAREKLEGRNIPKSIFIQSFLDSRYVIDRIRKDFNEKVVISLVKKNFETHAVEDVVEKPKPSESPSDFVIPGRYICDYKVFEYLKQIPKSPSGEYQLTDALKLLAKNEGLLAYEFEGHRYDTGDRLGYLEATLAYALKRDDLKDAVKKLIKTYV